MSKKKLLALVLALVMLLGLLQVTAAAEGDVSERTVPNDIDVSIISSYEFERSPGRVMSVDVEKISDTVYQVQDYYNSRLLYRSGQFIQFDLPADINVVAMWDGIGQYFDLDGVYNGQPAFDPESKKFSMQAAVNGAELQNRSWSGCYYFELSDGRIITLVFDATCHMSQIGVPNTIELFNEEANEELGGEYTISGLYAAAQQGLGFSTVVRAELDSEQASLLSVVVSGGEGERSRPDYYQIKAGVNQTWTESFFNTLYVNGIECGTFSCATDVNSARSLPFALREGINVVEIVMNCNGFVPSTTNGQDWFDGSSGTKTYIGAVFIIDFHGTPADIPPLSSNASIQEGSVAAYISGNINDYFERREVVFQNGAFSFAVPAAYREAAEDVNDSFSKGVVINANAFSPGAEVTLLENEGQNLLAGDRVGSCFGINIPQLPEDGTFTLRVTSADGTATKDYPVSVVFADSDAAISELSITGAELDEPFDENTHSYYLSFNGETDHAEIGFSLSGKQTVRLDGEAASGGITVDSSQPLHTLTVVAEDGITTSSYYFITVLPDGSVPYFSVSESTQEQATKLLGGYRSFVKKTESFDDVWSVFMAKAAADEIVDWNGKFVYNLEKNNPNRQATDPARAILTAILLGENPYHFDADGDGTYRDFVDELQGWSSGGPWANNIWYNMAAKAVGVEPRFEKTLKANATDLYYDLDMRAWVIASLNHCFGLEQKDMVPFIESLHNVQSTYENGLYTTDKYIGLWRCANGYGYDGNTYTIGTVLSAIASVGGDPDVLFAYSANGNSYDPLDQIERVMWDEETGAFTDQTASDSSFAKDMIIGLGDILRGSNVWDRQSLTEEKYAALLNKAAENDVDTASMPAFGEAGYGEAYYSLYAAVADKLEESGDTSMRPKVIWGLPDEVFVEHVEALPGEDAEDFVEYVGGLIEEYEGLDDIDENIISYLETTEPEVITAYRTAVAAALNKQDSTGVTADFYTRVLALPDALLIGESSKEEVDALRAIYDGMTTTQRDLVDWAGASVLLHLQAAEAALGKGSDSNTMTVHFALLGAPDDGENGAVNTLKDGNLDTWLEDDYTFNAETISAEQAFRVIMGDAGTSWKGGSSNSYGTLYVSAVKNPTTGEWMEEFTTTANSGWMYTVNGLHPNMGLSAYMLKDGDTFVFHYTDDFTLETDPWDGTIVNDESKTGAATTITDAATGTFVVECDRACAVLAKAEDGSYVLLPAAVTPGENGFVSFTAGDYNEVLIRMKGDLTGDGIVDSSDTLMMKKLAAGLETPDAITALLMDLTGEGETNSSDTLKMKRVAAGLDTLPW